MLRSSRSVLSTFGAIGAITFVIAACGSSKDSTFGGSGDDSGTGGSSGGSFTGDGASSGPDAGDVYADDPPPTYCVLAGQPTPPKPGGTEHCPDDKNLPGCGCTTLGQTAACFTGLRVNRDLGQCKDGMTTCVKVDENTQAWGPCNGEVLPTPGQTKGQAACKCFSGGQWKIANLSPCFINYGDPSKQWPVSTVTDGSGSSGLPAGQSDCPKIPTGSSAPPPKPGSDWSTDSLKVDCAGHFKVCYELKAGSYDAPKPTDCSVTGKICVEADYPMPNVDQPFPNLPAWTSTDAQAACGAQWQASGGYGEMTVLGESILCDKVDDGMGSAEVFNRVKYCPAKCNGGMNPGDPDCQACQQGGSGMF